MTVEFTNLCHFIEDIADYADQIDDGLVRADIVNQSVTDGMDRVYLRTGFKVNDELHQFVCLLGVSPPRPGDPSPQDRGNADIAGIQAATDQHHLKLRRGVFA